MATISTKPALLLVTPDNVSETPIPVLLIPIIVNAFIQCFSQGIIMNQVYTYFHLPRVSHPNRTRDNRESLGKVSLVVCVALLSFAQTARYIFVTTYMAVLQKDVLTLASRWLEPLSNAVISCLVRGFFIHRAYKTTKSLLLICPLIVFQIIIFGWQIWLVVDVAEHYMARYIVITNVAFVGSTIGATLLDIILCIILCVCIYRARTGIAHLDRFLERLMLFFWSTALPPALAMIPAVVLYRVNSSRLNGSWCAVCLATSAKLYCHSLLRTLNSRDRMRDRLRKDSFSEFRTNAMQDHQDYNRGISRIHPALESTEMIMSAKVSPCRPSFMSEAATQFSESLDNVNTDRRFGDGAVTASSKYSPSRRSFRLGSVSHGLPHAHGVSGIPEEGAVEVEFSRTEVEIDPERIGEAI